MQQSVTSGDKIGLAVAGSPPYVPYGPPARHRSAPDPGFRYRLSKPFLENPMSALECLAGHSDDPQENADDDHESPALRKVWTAFGPLASRIGRTGAQAGRGTCRAACLRHQSQRCE